MKRSIGKALCASAFALTSLVSPSLADTRDDQGWYLTVGTGMSFSDESDIDITVDDVRYAGDADFTESFNGDIGIGHDFGDFRNSLSNNVSNEEAIELLNLNVHKFGHNIRPIIGTHPITKKKFLNFNESFSSYIIGLTVNESNSLKTFLSNHMNKPEDQMRWKWSKGDMVMWDNRVTMHYAVSDYIPQYRCMNRVTVVNDIRENNH